MNLEKYNKELDSLSVFITDYIYSLGLKHDVCFMHKDEYGNGVGWGNDWVVGEIFAYKKWQLNIPMPDFHYTGEKHFYKMQKIYTHFI